MTVKALAEQLGCKILCMPSPDKEICGAYIGDLLSWVMGRAKENEAWITIMSNVNVIAVASLCDVSAVILAEGVTLDAEVINLAREKGINVFTSSLSAYETAIRLHGALK